MNAATDLDPQRTGDSPEVDTAAQDPGDAVADMLTPKEVTVAEVEGEQKGCCSIPAALEPYAIVNSSYLLFTVTDGAVRMLVLLQAYKIGFGAWEIALMFTLYEVAGVFTNLLAGLAGAKWGMKWTLLVGLTLQLGGLGMLLGWNDAWEKSVGVWYVTFAQMLCGIAKDLVKLPGKTVSKLVASSKKQNEKHRLVLQGCTVSGCTSNASINGSYAKQPETENGCPIYVKNDENCPMRVLYWKQTACRSGKWTIVDPKDARLAQECKNSARDSGPKATAMWMTARDASALQPEESVKCTPGKSDADLFTLIVKITGYKNSFKGAGYFLGSIMLLWEVGTEGNKAWGAIGLLVLLVLLAIPWPLRKLPAGLGRAANKKSATLAATFCLEHNPTDEDKQNHWNRNWLSLGRCFMFGARDCWFEVPLPLFFRSALQWSRPATGAVLALYIIFYGQFQAHAEVFLKPLRHQDKTASPKLEAHKWHVVLWSLLILPPQLWLGTVVHIQHRSVLGLDGLPPSEHGLTATLMLCGIVMFAFIFGINSAINSFLIGKYSTNNSASKNMGFYYMSNGVAAGIPFS